MWWLYITKGEGMESWTFLCFWMHKARSMCVWREAKHNFCSLWKDQWTAGKEQGSREQRRGETLIWCSVSVLRWQVFPPHKFLLYNHFLYKMALFQSLIQNQKGCHGVNASCSSSVLLRLSSGGGPQCNTYGCFLFQKGTMPLQSRESFPSLSRNEKGNLEILPSLLPCSSSMRERNSQSPACPLHFDQGHGAQRHFPCWPYHPPCSFLSALLWPSQCPVCLYFSATLPFFPSPPSSHTFSLAFSPPAIPSPHPKTNMDTNAIPSKPSLGFSFGLVE